jgi:hypothetical protein
VGGGSGGNCWVPGGSFASTTSAVCAREDPLAATITTAPASAGTIIALNVRHGAGTVDLRPSIKVSAAT